MYHKEKRGGTMWFWWFVLVSDLLVPVIQIIFGWLMWKHGPKSVNNIYGYRTARSKKNPDTWKFANEHCGRIWWKAGLVLLVLTVLAHIPFYGADEDTLGNLCLIVTFIQLAVLIGSIFPTERALKRTFNEDGTRK